MEKNRIAAKAGTKKVGKKPAAKRDSYHGD
jgi:hypothetical protein